MLATDLKTGKKYQYDNHVGL